MALLSRFSSMAASQSPTLDQSEQTVVDPSRQPAHEEEVEVGERAVIDDVIAEAADAAERGVVEDVGAGELEAEDVVRVDGGHEAALPGMLDHRWCWAMHGVRRHTHSRGA